VVKDYSGIIMRGDRIGIIGPNGAGKSTLLKLILGTLEPDAGTVRLGTNLSIAYFDQMRDQLDENATLADVINPGSEWIEIEGNRKHVMSYLGDFLFPPARAHSPVSSLSGGERARLLLARLFARPANVLVLDEPTNDLDIETLELLEELLQDYSGTVLLVSHDRSFLDNVVTQTIASEGDGKWKDYVGGYSDWERQRPPMVSAQDKVSRQSGAKHQPGAKDEPAASDACASSTMTAASRPNAPTNKPRPGRLTSWEAKELEKIPADIETLETEQSHLVEQMGNTDLYKSDPSKLSQIQSRLAEIESLIQQKMERWEVLEQKQSP